jgi:Mg2+ and Co2+ transporter CorA
VNTDSHLFLDTLEQMREILSSPDIESRARNASLTKTILEFYELIDEYALEQSSDLNAPESTEKIKMILEQLTSKIDTIDQHINLNLKKLSFLSKVAPKR